MSHARITRGLPFFLSALLVCGFVGAESNEKPNLQIYVPELDSDTTTCGIQKSSLESIAALTLRNNGIHASQKTNPYLFIHPRAYQIKGVEACIAYLSVTVEMPADKQSVNGFKARGETSTQLCGREAMYHGPISGMASQTIGYVEDMVKLCLGDLEY